MSPHPPTPPSPVRLGDIAINLIAQQGDASTILKDFCMLLPYMYLPTSGWKLCRVMRKPVFLHMRKQSCRSAAQLNCAADQPLCFCYIYSTFPLLRKSKISSLLLSPIIAQPSFCQTWSESPKTGFLMTRFNLTEDTFFSKRDSFVIDNHSTTSKALPHC